VGLKSAVAVAKLAADAHQLLGAASDALADMAVEAVGLAVVAVDLEAIRHRRPASQRSPDPAAQ